MYNLLHRSLFGLKDALDRTGVYRTAAALKREQYLAEDRLHDLRSERLTTLLRHAAAESPYYRDLFTSIGLTPGDRFDLDDLRNIPVLTRDILQEHAPRILSPGSVGHYADSSGGSTGAPVNFYHDQTYLNWARANELLYLSWMNIRPGDRTAIFWGADRDLKDESLYVRLMLRLNRVYPLNSFEMSDQRVARFLDRLEQIRPRYIYGYASSLFHVARYINEHRPLRFRPVAIRSSAETLYDVQRNEIERAFAAPVYNFYGSREVNNVASECPAHDGLHIFASGRIVEIVDIHGRPVPTGQVGQVAVTDLTNRAFPFIRYLNGDLAALKPGRCACGRTYPRLESITGRVSDIMEVDGRQIHGEYFTHLFYGRPEIKAFQIIQETEHDFTLLIVPRAGAVDTAFYRTKITEKLGGNINLTISLTEHIAPTAGGKHRFTISRLPGRTRRSSGTP